MQDGPRIRAPMRGPGSFRCIPLALIIFMVGGYFLPKADLLIAAQSPVVNLADEVVDPLQSASGKITVLIFVRTDCPISNRYAPTMKRLAAAHAEKVSFRIIYPRRAE